MTQASDGVTSVAVIPARFASQRFPGKMLADETGKPLIQHTYERVRKARRISRVIVATDDQRIVEAVRRFGGEVMLTDPDHPSGTDRVAEVVADRVSEPVILNVQGDEPEISPVAIDALVEAFHADPAAEMGTLAREIDTPMDYDDPHTVKVVLSLSGRALYFSRSGIPYYRATEGRGRCFKHLGIYIFRREFLLLYPKLSPTPLEQIEKLEQLRALEHGHSIMVSLTRYDSSGVDTPADYQRFVARVLGVPNDE